MDAARCDCWGLGAVQKAMALAEAQA
jgi:hypothetical protein